MHRPQAHFGLLSMWIHRPAARTRQHFQMLWILIWFLCFCQAVHARAEKLALHFMIFMQLPLLRSWPKPTAAPLHCLDVCQLVTCGLVTEPFEAAGSDAWPKENAGFFGRTGDWNGLGPGDSVAAVAQCLDLFGMDFCSFRLDANVLYDWAR